VDFVAADMPSVNRLTVHVLAAVAEHEREMISQRTKAALAAAKVRGTRFGNPRLPPTGTLAAMPEPSTPGGVARVASAQARAVAAYGAAIEAARAAGARSLGDYAQALQGARLPAPRGGDRWSRPSVARVLRYCDAGGSSTPITHAGGGQQVTGGDGPRGRGQGGRRAETRNARSSERPHMEWNVERVHAETLSAVIARDAFSRLAIAPGIAEAAGATSTCCAKSAVGRASDGVLVTMLKRRHRQQASRPDIPAQKTDAKLGRLVCSGSPGTALSHRRTSTTWFAHQSPEQAVRPGLRRPRRSAWTRPASASRAR